MSLSQFICCMRMRQMVGVPSTNLNKPANDLSAHFVPADDDVSRDNPSNTKVSNVDGADLT